MNAASEDDVLRERGGRSSRSFVARDRRDWSLDRGTPSRGEGG